MQYRQLGRAELRVSSLGLGCVTFGREIDADTSFAIMDRALAAGITLFDTAEAYAEGRSEEVVGAWLAERRARDSVVLATKIRPPLTRARILAGVDASLRRLQTESIDLYQAHSWDGSTPLEETLEAFDSVLRQGKARYIGSSNFAAWQVCKSLWQAAMQGRPHFESAQNCYNLVARDVERELLPLSADQGLGVITYSPLGGGFLSGKYRPGGQIPPGSRMDVVPGMQPLYFHAAGYRVLERLQDTAARLGVTPARLALSWVIHAPGITSVLVGATRVEQVDQALAADALELGPELRAELQVT